MAIKNIFPSVLPGASRLAVVVECPSKDDILTGESFNSSSGRFLKGLLSSVGVVPQQCFFGYVYDKPAPYGTITQLRDKDVELSDSIEQLVADLVTFNPNCVLLLGAGTLKTFGGTHALDNYRGSIFESTVLGPRFKCVASYTPLHCFQTYVDTHLLKFDMHRASQESYSKELNLPDRTIVIASDIGTAFNFLNQVESESTLVGFDVEGYPDKCGITCFSFAPSQYFSTVIPLRRMDGSSVFDPYEESLIWQKLCEILESPNVEIICQNALYELFMMAYRHGIVIRNVKDDTMVKHWELYQEFEKNLGLQTSLYTREPYFKDGRHSSTNEGHWLYNGKDSCILLDINDTTDKLLKRHQPSEMSYQFKMRLLKPYVYMSMKGCRIDLKTLLEHRHRLIGDITKAHNDLTSLVGRPINAKSWKDKNWLLYEHLGLPAQYTGRGAERKLTSNEEAILNCRLSNTNPLTDTILSTLLDLVKARTDFSDTYKLEPFEDGRIRSSYNPVGTDTGRVNSSATSVRAPITKAKVDIDKKTGRLTVKAETAVEFLGTNLQNVSEWLRDVFIPDPGHVFWQYDLSGADAWTVAADLYALGAPAMFEHLTMGVKPSCVILMMRKYGTEVIHWSTERILEVQPEMKNAGKMYVCAKACQHGTNYGMGGQLLADTIFKRSGGNIRITGNEAKLLQQSYEGYYRVSLRERYITSELSRHGYLDTASGTRRRFLNIRNSMAIDPATVRAALSFEPQNNTTFATNLALHNLYYLPDNRAPDGSLIHQPLLMIHDALAGQTPVDKVDSHKHIITQAFNITMNIHGIPVTIPVEGGFGPNWKETK